LILHPVAALIGIGHRKVQKFQQTQKKGVKKVPQRKAAGLFNGTGAAQTGTAVIP
jgi:hypothetical protein